MQSNDDCGIHDILWEPPVMLPGRTQLRQVQTRVSLQAKLLALVPGHPPELTHLRLLRFGELFATCFDKASITRVTGGPSDWTALPGRVDYKHILRHLLGDRIPSLKPQWVAVRSFKQSRYICLDVDAHEKTIGKKRPKISFDSRCKQVEEALRRMRIDPDNPRHVLIQKTPSGGRHYFVFFDEDYYLQTYKDLLIRAGLEFLPGHIEFYPSQTHPIRLPFGHLPNEPRDDLGWTKFIDRYHNFKIKRHSASKISQEWDLPAVNLEGEVFRRTLDIRPNITPQAPRNGIPRRFQVEDPREDPDDVDYRRLLLTGITTQADAELLFKLGIRLAGTRNQVLKHLAWHLICVRGHSAASATTELSIWARDTRHKSHEIADDLSRGTNKVGIKIKAICDWIETKAKNTPRRVAVNVLFAASEIRSLQPYLAKVEVGNRKALASFALRFLAYAKEHDVYTTTDGRGGWKAAPSVNSVMRFWPRCSKMLYKKWLDMGLKCGLFTLVREKWHNRYGIGRARTYCLHVPDVPAEQCVIGLQDGAKIAAALETSRSDD